MYFVLSVSYLCTIHIYVTQKGSMLSPYQCNSLSPIHSLTRLTIRMHSSQRQLTMLTPSKPEWLPLHSPHSHIPLHKHLHMCWCLQPPSQHQQKSTFLIPSYSILLHLIPLILGVRRE